MSISPGGTGPGGAENRAKRSVHSQPVGVSYVEIHEVWIYVEPYGVSHMVIVGAVFVGGRNKPELRPTGFLSLPSAGPS